MTEQDLGDILIESKEKDVKWYDPEIRDRLTDQFRNMFLNYSGIPEDELESHLKKIHDKAWEIRPYPCIGMWSYLFAKIAVLPSFDEILSRVKQGDTILELGACFGQDLRYLASRGAPTDRMHASDLVAEFWQCGYELFRDGGADGGEGGKNRFQAKFVQADIFDAANNAALASIKPDIVYMGSFLHLWDWDEQVEALKVIIGLAKPVAGTFVAGCQVGGVQGVSISTGFVHKTSSQFMHNEASMKELWRLAAEATGSKWDVTAISAPISLTHPQKRDYEWMGPTARTLMFEARRLA